jgi:hypothetical protein
MYEKKNESKKEGEREKIIQKPYLATIALLG